MRGVYSSDEVHRDNPLSNREREERRDGECEGVCVCVRDDKP